MVNQTTCLFERAIAMCVNGSIFRASNSVIMLRVCVCRGESAICRSNNNNSNYTLFGMITTCFALDFVFFIR